MERIIRPNAETGMDRLGINIYGKIYVHGQHLQLLMMKYKYDKASKWIDICRLHMMLCLQK